ncbi:MAG: heavy-metal-associated domain-containing protein [Candidatus Fimimonas sp.]
MKKIIKLQNLDCAHCAMKMEDALRKIEGVESVSVSFITQRMTIEANEEGFDKIIEKAKKVCKKVEPDCVLIV